MLDLEAYVGPWSGSKDWTEARQENAERLIDAVNGLMAEAEADGVEFQINPTTDTIVSGQHYGGFRPQSCPQGAPKSSHKEGLAVDLYDPHNQIDDWCMANLNKLESYGIFIEHPDSTPHWSHWTIKAPGSGRRVFYP